MLHDILLVLLGLVIGAVIGFFVSRKLMTKYIKENPPINEDMIKALMAQMGRKPNQKQINQMMKAMQKYQQALLFYIKKTTEIIIIHSFKLECN